jgi:hypothetical protein
MNNTIVIAIAGRVIWVLFAFVFFYSGLFTTEWLLEPEHFAGGWRWVLVGLFPVLVPAFFGRGIRGHNTYFERQISIVSP